MVCFDPEVGQPGEFTYKRQFQPSSPISGKGKEPQGLARIADVHTNESDSKVGPLQFTREFSLHEPKPIEPDVQSTTKHPYVKAPDLALPMRNVPTAVSQPLLWSDCAYTTTTNIYNPRVTQKVFDQILEAKVTIMQWELLSLAPEIWSWMSDATTKWHLAQTMHRCHWNSRKRRNS